MATLIQTIVTAARRNFLLEPAEVTDGYWTDQELLAHAVNGIKDLQKKIIDLYADHFVTLDTTNLSAVANTQALSGVPSDLLRVKTIQPRVLGPMATNRGLIFKYRQLTHPDFVQSEAMPAVDPNNRVIYYAVINAGAPVAAPSILIAPTLSAAVPLTLKYVPTIGTLTLADNNPIPGESDRAIEAYIAAFARAKEREDRSPDTEALSIYATEARSLLIALTPRSEQEPEYVVGMFEHEYGGAE